MEYTSYNLVMLIDLILIFALAITICLFAYIGTKRVIYIFVKIMLLSLLLITIVIYSYAKSDLISKNNLRTALKGEQIKATDTQLDSILEKMEDKEANFNIALVTGNQKFNVTFIKEDEKKENFLTSTIKYKIYTKNSKISK